MSINQTNKPVKKMQSGFTLIEVLVAAVVLSVGLIGLAALQANGLQSTHSAYLRSQATSLSYDIIDRMRANSDMAASYDIDLGTAPTSMNCFTSSCTPADLVNHDLTQWKNQLAALLPQGDGAISNDGGGAFTITVQYFERNANQNGGDLTSLSIDTRL